MDYLLDTNACIALNKGNPRSVRTHFDKALREGAEVWVSTIVLYEIWYGIAKSTMKKENEDDMATFLGGPVQILNFENKDAKEAGEVRAALERIGKPIGAYDVLIAGQALNRGYKLVTANTREFRRVAELDWEDWGKG